MNNPYFDVQQLLRRDPRVWTNLLCSRLHTPGVIVEAVQAQVITPALTRFTLQLTDHTDPISLLGKHTTANEARFYEQLGPQLAFVTPHCWYAHTDGDDGWIVIEDIPNDRRPTDWISSDVEAIVGELAFVHALFWDQTDYLGRYAWLSPVVGQPQRDAGGDGIPLGLGWSPLEEAPLSEHSLMTAGTLAPLLTEAVDGLRQMQAIGGWPGIIDDKHLEAAADLLDDPLPVLQPLRDLPQTLLHGFPGIYNWRRTLFDDARLIDWQTVATGPAACDLVVLVESFGLLQKPVSGSGLLREWLVAEEHIVDTYVLQMGQDMGRAFDARALRRALPAARCLHVLTHWFPRFNSWFRRLSGTEEAWRQFNNLTDEQLAQTLHTPVAGMSAYLGAVFHRFLNAYHQL